MSASFARTLGRRRCTIVDVSGERSPAHRICVVGPVDERVPGLAYTVHEQISRALATEGLVLVAETHVVPSSPTCPGERLHRRAVDALTAGRRPASSSGFSAFTDRHSSPTPPAG